MICSRLSSQLLFDPALRLFAPQLPISELLTQPSAHSFLLLWPSRRHHLIQAIDVHDIAHMRRSDGYAVELWIRSRCSWQRGKWHGGPKSSPQHPMAVGLIHGVSRFTNYAFF